MRVDIRGIPVHYEERGEGRPILLLHGMSVDPLVAEWLDRVETETQP